MDQTEQRIINQDSDRQENTIITWDAEQSVFYKTGALASLASHVSSEPMAEFTQLTGRWIHLDSSKFKTSDKRGHGSATYYLPENIYKGKIS